MFKLKVTRPFEFVGPYAGCYAVRQMAMDERHVYTMFDILHGWEFRNALELGSFAGASSTAFVEAINAGSKMMATFCDVQLTGSLRSVLGNCKHPNQLRITKEPSWNVLESPEEFDFILVDANHDMESVSLELERIVPRRPLCVMAHDTSATDNGYVKAEGAQFLKETFRAMPGYHCIEDARKRPGEETHRGLFFATTNFDLYLIANEAYAKWCGESILEKGEANAMKLIGRPRL